MARIILFFLCLSISFLGSCQEKGNQSEKEVDSYNWASPVKTIVLNNKNYDTILGGVSNMDVIPLFDAYGKMTISFQNPEGEEIHIGSIDYALREKLRALLEYEDKDWIGNLLLYSLTKTDASPIKLYSEKNKYLDWKEFRKQEDLLFWSEYFSN